MNKKIVVGLILLAMIIAGSILMSASAKSEESVEFEFPEPGSMLTPKDGDIFFKEDKVYQIDFYWGDSYPVDVDRDVYVGFIDSDNAVWQKAYQSGSEDYYYGFVIPENLPEGYYEFVVNVEEYNDHTYSWRSSVHVYDLDVTVAQVQEVM